ncbi:G-protein coupled receptor Mth isoform X2 [Drosophila serrata]|uniref:G-protein coupled receptor Mth isoform X2 n=1 Tax=Drosophila serrata TaxID=7274 RepID=UPI000A1D0B67|nr:G-protein coupled receptor Mth isoform X2 [Drosophila serrata]
MRLSTVLLWVLVLQQTFADIPDCDYFDTVDLSASQRLPNGSYIYEGLLIPDKLTGEYDYRLMPDDSKESADRHWRGCACKLKPCVRFCCRHDQILENGECNDAMEQELAQIDPYLNVTRADGSVVKRHFRTQLILQKDLPMPCTDLYPLDNRRESDTYTLYENGTFLRHMDNAAMNKRGYCIQHNQLDANDPDPIRIVPHNCLIRQPKTGQTVVMMTSLVCMILTIGVYLCVKKLHRNLQGKSFICYMVCLFMGYFILLLDLWDLSEGFCLTAGFLGHFFVMAAFFWLSVISLHLWNGFRGSSSSHNHVLPNYLFLAFNAYAFGMAAILTVIIYLVDTFVERGVPENEDWMPRVGYYSCWINTVDWSAMLYFYGPMLVLIAFNMTMFILTAIRIVAVKKELKTFTQRQERKKKLNSEKQTYSFFLRLFIIMGMSWSLEIISYLVQNNEFWRKVFEVADYFNWSQGIIIFVLFVLKRSTLKLCMDRIRGKSKKAEADVSGEEISLEETQLAPSLL